MSYLKKKLELQNNKEIFALSNTMHHKNMLHQICNFMWTKNNRNVSNKRTFIYAKKNVNYQCDKLVI